MPKAADATALVDTVDDLRAQLSRRRAAGTIGLVPTMGALHAGHARLIEMARAACETVVVTIFVNPLQFDRQDDLAKYPRTLQADLALCEQLGVDVLFVPSAAEVYPASPVCTVKLSKIADHLCGRFRPGHFEGVATVVLKLFNMVQPDRAYFGEKDAQQLAIIRRLVADFNLPLAIVGVPTVREADGLALSSRNRHLAADERPLALSLFRALSAAKRAMDSGGQDVNAITAEAAALVPDDSRVRLEYLEIVDPVTMQPVERVTGPVVIAGALWVGSTRLIDNISHS